MNFIPLPVNPIQIPVHHPVRLEPNRSHSSPTHELNSRIVVTPWAVEGFQTHSLLVGERIKLVTVWLDVWFSKTRPRLPETFWLWWQTWLDCIGPVEVDSLKRWFQRWFKVALKQTAIQFSSCSRCLIPGVCLANTVCVRAHLSVLRHPFCKVVLLGWEMLKNISVSKWVCSS